MHFVLYTDKQSVAQCMTALMERMEQKPTKTRPEIKGWVEKKEGRFEIALTEPMVANVIKRTTRLQGNAFRKSGITVIEGYVPDGASPRDRRFITLALVAVGGVLFVLGQAFLALVALTGAFFLYILLKGDYENGDRLLVEIERLFKASPNPPKHLRDKF